MNDSQHLNNRDSLKEKVTTKYLNPLWHDLDIIVVYDDWELHEKLQENIILSYSRVH